MKLYGYTGLTLSRKVMVTSYYAGVHIDQVLLQHGDNKTPDYLKKNPNGKFPVLETSEGKYIFESNSIMRYVARLDKSKGLYGSDILEESLVDQWLDWTANEIAPSYYSYIAPYFGWGGNKETAKAAEQKLRSTLKILDDHLKINTFMVGNKVTIADISLACGLFIPFRFLWDEKWRKTIPNVSRWFETLMTQEPFMREYGRLILCVKPLEITVVAEEKKEEKKKEEKPAAKKEEKKPAEKPAAKKEAAEEEEGAAEKKEKNPLDLLPPSNFNLFDFKTLFVNAANKQDAMDYFWKNFDPQGYSIWFITYDKAEGEGKVLFLTSNLMNGFLQRLEHFRKYAFAVHGVYGDEPNLEIRGVWVWRGTELPKEITDLDSYEYHKFTKLNPVNEADRKKVNEFWTGLNEDEDVVDGLKARTVKYFK